MFVVLVATDGGFGDTMEIKQFLRLARVFARDAVSTTQHIQSAQRNVAQIADGSGSRVEPGASRDWLSEVVILLAV